MNLYFKSHQSVFWVKPTHVCRLLLSTFLFFTMFTAAAQSNGFPVSGTVTNATGKPIPSVSIVEKGTQKATVTKDDGSFSITTESGSAVLIFSSVNYETQEVNINNKGNLTVVLKESEGELDEVVVTALGIQRKAKSLTYSTQIVKGSDLTKVKDANPMNNLTGKVSGLQINRSSSGIGGSVSITLRGLKSLRNNQPLYIIDGLPITNVSGSGSEGAFGGNPDRGDILSTINPDDIISINVLKGASASALYGSDGANGAIMITTKKGSSGATKIDISSAAMIDQAFYLPKLQYRYGQTPTANGTAEDSWGPKGSFDDHVKDFFNTGTTLINSVSLSGGTAKTQSYFSYANTTNKGVMPTNKFNQHTISFRNTAKFFDDKLSFDGSLMYSTQNTHNRPTSGLYFNVLSGLYMFPRGLDFNSYRDNFEYLSPTRNLMLQNWYEINFDKGLSGTHHEQNPYWVLYRNPTDQKRQNLIGSINLKYNLTDWLTLSARGNLNQIWNNFERRVYAGTQGVISGQTSAKLPVDNGRYIRDESSGRNIYADLLLNGNKNITEDVTLNFTVGTSITDLKNRGWSLDARKLKAANVFLLNGIYSDEPNSIANLTEAFLRFQRQSVFASANFGFKEALYLDLTARNDWSSTLANTPSEKSGYFYYSAGLSVLLNEIVKLPTWNNLSKLRFTYAQVGNDVAQFASIIPRATFGTGIININNSGVFEDQPLKPELSQSFELGYEGRFLKNRLGLDVALYKTNTSNQYVSFAGPSGLLNTTLFLNAGNVENKGIEIALNYDVIKQDKLNWTTGFNYTANRNKVLELHPKLGARYPIGGNFNVLRVGGSFGDFWAKRFLRDEQGKMVVTNDSIPMGDPTDGYIGTSNPSALVGWTNNLSYGRFSMSLNIDGRFGGSVISVTQGYLNSFGYSEESAAARDAGYVAIDAVTQDGTPVTRTTAQKYYQGIGNRDGIIEGLVYSATNIRLRELSVAYAIPVKSKIIKSANVSLIGRNLFFFKNNAPYDPELNTNTGAISPSPSNPAGIAGGQGYDSFGLPTTRSYGINLRLSL